MIIRHENVFDIILQDHFIILTLRKKDDLKVFIFSDVKDNTDEMRNIKDFLKDD